MQGTINYWLYARKGTTGVLERTRQKAIRYMKKMPKQLTQSAVAENLGNRILRVDQLVSPVVLLGVGIVGWLKLHWNGIGLQSISQVVEEHRVGEVLGAHSVAVEQLDRRLLQEVIAVACLYPLLGSAQEGVSAV